MAPSPVRTPCSHTGQAETASAAEPPVSDERDEEPWASILFELPPSLCVEESFLPYMQILVNAEKKLQMRAEKNRRFVRVLADELVDLHRRALTPIRACDVAVESRYDHYEIAEAPWQTVPGFYVKHQADLLSVREPYLKIACCRGSWVREVWLSAKVVTRTFAKDSPAAFCAAYVD